MQDRFEQRMQMSLLLREVDNCKTIGEIFDLVKREHIVIRMKSQNAASNIPLEPLEKNPAISPIETLRKQVREAIVAMFTPAEKKDQAEEAPCSEEKRELLEAIDTCPTIDKLFELVRDRHIVIRMKSQNAASNIPFQPLPENPAISPLETLRAQVREAADAMFQNDEKQDLINAVKTCPSIDKLFELVRDRHIVIRMKSQNSASCLPQKQFSEAELKPDTTPLERLRQQVLEAIIYG